MKKFRCRFYDPTFNYFKTRVVTITAKDRFEAEVELRRWNTVSQLVSIHEIIKK